MDDKHFDALSAFFDGEPVDPALLTESLGQPGAATLLAEFAAMRAHVRQDASRPDPGYADLVAAKLQPPVAHRSVRRVLRSAVFAGVMLLAGIVGYMLGAGSPARMPRTPFVVQASRADAGHQAITPAPASVPSPHEPPRLARPTGPNGPPLAALRLRFAKWHENSVETDRETGRH